ncbi:ornithine cyclodeaminase [Corynebacterium phocae]|uniref:Ornithine cyclodeaminase n=1 Tax=Corynebacterium phocae TaxID=161895 RepID=A0A1L7D5A2_9CORY|nr:ornithine cyclodeaminase family protein [Corynebacterium phocae]APT93112.1 ornithine cyclodeaminase [Corynebacterium phocae]KAA8722186.1 ornithine cyclodeaminase family protein [Corynebacterium phocae]
MSLNVIDHDTVLATLTPAQAVHALRQALQDGVDPSADALRTSTQTNTGQLLSMPSANAAGFGTKLIAIAGPAAPEGVPLIQGTYVLFDGHTLAPSAVIDGVALTNLRTPAVSISCVYDLLNGGIGPLKVAIFGTGAQGRAHANTIRDTFDRAVEITFISRTQPADLDNWVEAGTTQAQAAVKEAELVICATTASEPVLGLADVRPEAVIVALGSHTPEARELSGELMAAAQVIIEDHGATLKEGGDVIQAIEEGHLAKQDLITYSQVVRQEVQLDRSRPVVFKFTGMSWEDLVIAQAIAQEAAPEGTARAR